MGWAIVLRMISFWSGIIGSGIIGSLMAVQPPMDFYHVISIEDDAS
jgi:hypothetical protein